MNDRGSRSGSALLIVLGMMAFMTISAVAFSAFMRHSRLPSNYLRRSVASRELVKGALARAIDGIDQAVNNNPHPGIGGRHLDSTRRNVNGWCHRVLMATNAFSEVNGASDPSLTVPVLTLEGLAYVPPPLINAARYYSRRTPTAQWHSFDFDAGRYAWFALDVSDYFDVNRTLASYGRTSASNGRVSLAYLFETGSGHTGAGSGTAGWETFMDQFRTHDESTMSFSFGSKTPLVSLADLNLAMRDRSFGDIRSPWYEYVAGKGQGYTVYSSDEAARRDRMTFVTDGIFTDAERTDAEDADYDLADAQNQPFAPALLRSPAQALSVLLCGNNSGVTKGMLRMMESVPALGMLALYDYLDGDSVPVSLAVPTAERAPMVCGIQPNLQGAQVKVVAKKPAAPTVLSENGKQRKVERTDVYTIDGASIAAAFQSPGVRTLVAYPYPHPDGFAPETFSVQGRLAVFFTREDAPMKMRTGNPGDVLHWGNYTTLTTPGLNNNAIWIPLGGANGKPVSFPDAIDSEEKAVKAVDLSLDNAAPTVASAFNNNAALLTVTYRWDQTDISETGVPNWDPANPALDDMVSAHSGMAPLLPAGIADGSVANDAQLLAALKGGNAPSLRLNAAIWIRVGNRDGKTVDLVPACLLDDADLNANMMAQSAMMVHKSRLGSQYPVMRFDTGVGGIDLNVAKLDARAENGTAENFKLSPETVMVADPRYNFAPEHWFGTSDALSYAAWRSAIAVPDGDIFMNTSDQGYLQSVYELAFVPRVSALAARGDKFLGDFVTPEDGREGFLGKDKVRNAGLMWKTYDPFGRFVTGGDDFEGVGFVNAGSGQKVNPYSDSPNILMAAFANTPADWACASTNKELNATGKAAPDAATFNRDYAWNAYSSAQNQRFAYGDLEAIAGEFSDRLRSAPDGTDWQDVWNGMPWGGTGDDGTFGGVTLSDGTADLWSVDRKFLYGYWRDCFAAKQQLFLVFVRAEPMMMGGEGLGSSPPQLGARAVALVWRDPRRTSGTTAYGEGYPHRTRVLFYKQLE